ncbi:MotA/TolQ/ExbB proton channel family protein [Schleiferiaceae bacterium]|jgi:biopolymer transport protein ExbB|nr:MotA/TolQ/ExbB proton channel family protein [Schleiferiaceae bacterium]|tara:strand:- start:157 stop:855 length:699 start_codon:yes stop_codon:yes gene_type:complete
MSTLYLQIQTGADALLTGEPTEKTMTILELMTSGGIGGILIMVFLSILSVFAVYIFFERFGAIRSANKVDPNFMNNIKDMVLDGKLDAAGALCKAESTPVARMIEKGISRIGKPLGDITQAIENQGKLEVTRLEKGLPMLATISGGAPMIGFLGTVIGMILTFKEMANAGGQIKLDMMAEGIYTAMTTTVAGLLVGIVAYFGYNFLVTRVDRVVYKLEDSAMDFLDLLHEPA